MLLEFKSGTLTLNGCPDELPPEPRRYLTPDPRTGEYRARACDYAALFLALRGAKLEFTDRARAFAPLTLASPGIQLRLHQINALAAWQA